MAQGFHGFQPGDSVGGYRTCEQRCYNDHEGGDQEDHGIGRFQLYDEIRQNTNPRQRRSDTNGETDGDQNEVLSEDQPFPVSIHRSFSLV